MQDLTRSGPSVRSAVLYIKYVSMVPPSCVMAEQAQLLAMIERSKRVLGGGGVCGGGGGRVTARRLIAALRRLLATMQRSRREKGVSLLIGLGYTALGRLVESEHGGRRGRCGYAKSRQGVEAAKSMYGAAIRIFPKLVEARYELAVLKRRDSKTVAADSRVLEQLRRAVRCADELAPAGSPSLEGEISAGKEAQRALALLLCQRGRFREADSLLEGIGYTHRLANDVLCYPKRITRQPACADALGDAVLGVFDNSLPENLFEAIRAAFARTSPFWVENEYDASRTG